MLSIGYGTLGLPRHFHDPTSVRNLSGLIPFASNQYLQP